MGKISFPDHRSAKKMIALLPEPCGMYCQGDGLHTRWSVQNPVTAFGSDPEF
jgi:hypothetical protein